MTRPQTLADFLGTSEPRQDEPDPLRLEEITNAKEFAQAVLSSIEFRRYVVNGLILGELPAAIVTRMMDYAWGKPVERLEVKDTTTRPEDLTPDQLEARAMRLAEMARSMRLEPMEQESVH